MPTPTKFDKQQILSAALRVVAREGGGASIGAISSELGAPTGSIYHRFTSKDALLGELWLATVSDFERGFLSALGGDRLEEAGRAAALWTPSWVRSNSLSARLLLLHRREDFLGKRWPEEMAARAETLASELEKGLRTYARRLYGPGHRDGLARVRFGLVDVPYGATRPYVIAERKPPAWLDELIVASFQAVLPSGGESSAP